MAGQQFEYGFDDLGNRTHAYADGVGGVLAIRQLSITNTQPSTDFIATDGNGKVTALVSANDGSVTANYDYRPSGELVRADGVMANVLFAASF